jgi:hypothetical protein
MRNRTPSTRAVGTKRRAMTLSTVDFRMRIDQYPAEALATNSVGRTQDEVSERETDSTPSNQQDTNS